MEIDSRSYLTLFPTTSLLVDWYRRGHRDLPWRRDPTPYHVWISEIMLQQTRVQAVIPYYLRFLSLFPDVGSLADAAEGTLLKAWEGLGYYSRARNLQKAARIIAETGFPTDYEGWLALPGIGPYTAGAICSIALGLPTPAADGNLFRVYSRLLALEEDIAAPKTKKALTQLACALLPPQCPGEYNQSLMELGATVCLPNGEPLCGGCPVSSHCRAFQDGNPSLFPLKSPKKPRRVQPLTVFLLEWEGRWAICQRPEKGLLARLWEFPNREGTLSAQQALEEAASMGLSPLDDPVGLPAAVHTFTHIQWQMTGWHIPVKPCGDTGQLVWATPEQLRGQYPIPSAFSPFLPICLVDNDK